MTWPADPAQQEERLFAILSGDRFLRMRGLGEIPFFIYPYDPHAAIEVEAARKRIVNRLGAQGRTVREIDLYDLSVDLLKARGDWDEVLAVEPEMDKADFAEMLRAMLEPEEQLAPAIRARLEAGPDFDLVLLTGIGEVFPYIRTHTVLNNLQSVVTDRPLLVFFPGEYTSSTSLGSSLVLFGLLKDDQFYRAKDIRDQEP